MKILLGSYTRQSSEGIYEITLNTKSNQLENLNLIGKVGSPTYLDYNPKTKTLYSVYQKEDTGGLGTWKRLENGQLELVSSILSPGSAPCYVKYHDQDKLIYTANYHQGLMTIYNEEDIVREVQYEDGAHAHFTDFDPKTDLLYVCDLGNDKVYKYDGEKEVDQVRLEEGSGPRHIAFHPSLDRMYVFGELNNTITVMDSDLNIYQIISTLQDPETQSSGAAIRISSDGNFLYASNRGEDSIVSYTVDAKGDLKLLESLSTQGQHPRDFALSPDEKYVVVANRDSNNLSLFERNQESGRLTLLQKDVHAPEAVSVLFIQD